MSDFKSKLPDFKELASMGGKLFNGVKDAVNEIVDDYKKKRAPVAEKKAEPKPAPKKAAPKEEAAPAVTKTATAKKTATKATKKD